jgi:hypothetical protein
MESQKTPLPDSLNPCIQVKRSCQRVVDLIKSKEQINVQIKEDKIDEFVKSLE